METSWWKSEYQNRKKVSEYDKKRFSSIIGRIKNKNDWRALDKSLNYIPEDAEVINIPCGTGRFFPELMEKDFTMIAADISQEMLDYAKESYGDNEGKIIYKKLDIENLPYDDNHFEASIVYRLMHLIENEEKQINILREVNRVSQDYVIVTFHTKYTFKYFFQKLRLHKAPGKQSFRAIKRVVDKAGLQIHKIFPTGYLLSANWVLLLEAKS